MEKSSSPYPGNDYSADFARHFARRQAYLDAPEPLYTIERLEAQETDYAEKLTHTPLTPEIMHSLVETVFVKFIENGKTNDQFTDNLLQAIEIMLQAYQNKAEPGDFIVFSDLVDAAEQSLDQVTIPNGQAPWNHPIYIAQNNVIGQVLAEFADNFYNRADLQYICDEIDEWTVHDEVHPEQKQRRQIDPACPFYGQKHGFYGRWTPLEREDMTVWRLS